MGRDIPYGDVHLVLRQQRIAVIILCFTALCDPLDIFRSNRTCWALGLHWALPSFFFPLSFLQTSRGALLLSILAYAQWLAAIMCKASVHRSRSLTFGPLCPLRGWQLAILASWFMNALIRTISPPHTEFPDAVFGAHYTLVLEPLLHCCSSGFSKKIDR
jgi:hypothetical protein